MSTESLLWVPAIAMMITVTYICFCCLFVFFFLSIFVFPDYCWRAELRWYLLIFLNTFWITFEVLLTSLSSGGDGIICICGFIGWKLAFQCSRHLKTGFPSPLPYQPPPPPPTKKKKKKKKKKNKKKKKKKIKKNTRCIRKPPQKVLCFSLPPKCYQCLSSAYL